MKRLPRSLAPAHAKELSPIVEALLPLARICLQSGKGAGDLALAAKIACVKVASKDAILAHRLNHSQISAVTGLTRKEVRTLAGIPGPQTKHFAPRASKQRTDRVLIGWRTDPEFLDRTGRPMALQMRDGDASFHVLVRKYGGDVTPVSVLKELQRIGVVSKISGNRVHLKKTHVRTKGFTQDTVLELANRLSDYGTTLVDNVSGSERPIFTGVFDAQNLPSEKAALFLATFAERAAALLSSAKVWENSQTRLKQKPEADTANNRADIGIGIYLVRKRSKPARDTKRN